MKPIARGLWLKGAVAGATFYGLCLLLDNGLGHWPPTLGIDRGCNGGGVLYLFLNLPASLLAIVGQWPSAAPMVVSESGPTPEAARAWSPSAFIALGFASYSLWGAMVGLGLALRNRFKTAGKDGEQ